MSDPDSKLPSIYDHADALHPVTQPERQMDPAVAASQNETSVKMGAILQGRLNGPEVKAATAKADVEFNKKYKSSKRAAFGEP